MLEREGKRGNAGMDIKLVRELLARAIVASRAEISRYSDEARSKGMSKEVSAWRSRLRKIDRHVEQYGLDRYTRQP
jgi:hypothetical protein